AYSVLQKDYRMNSGKIVNLTRRLPSQESAVLLLVLQCRVSVRCRKFSSSALFMKQWMPLTDRLHECAIVQAAASPHRSRSARHSAVVFIHRNFMRTLWKGLLPSSLASGSLFRRHHMMPKDS